MKNSILFLLILLSLNCKSQNDIEVVKAFEEMSFSYYFTSIYVKDDFAQVRNMYKANRAPTEAFFFKGRQIVQQSSKGRFYYTLTSDIAVNDSSLTFYVQQTSTCEEAAVFLYYDKMIIVDFLNGTRLICSSTPLDLEKWQKKLQQFDKIKNK